MKTSLIRPMPALTAAALVLAASDVAFATFVTRSVGGDSTAASIQAIVDVFRADIGATNNGSAAGPLLGGRREINWDDGGAAITTSTTPFFAFQNIRGATFTTPGTGFVQAPASGLATQFGQAGYATNFTAFSAQRLFTPIGSNITEVTFSVPGSNGVIPASVGGFGAVFSDVDEATSSRLQFFNLAGGEIFSQTVPAGSVNAGSFSFLGASGNAGEQIFRVRITSGSVPVGVADGLNSDVVTVDDFIFREPVPIPEPTTVLFGLGLLGACLGGRPRRARLA